MIFSDLQIELLGGHSHERVIGLRFTCTKHAKRWTSTDGDPSRSITDEATPLEPHIPIYDDDYNIINNYMIIIFFITRCLKNAHCPFK